MSPASAEQLHDSPDELSTLVLAIARRVAGEAEAEGLAKEAESWIRGSLAPDYPWPGNVRELEQCVRNILIRGTYRPRRTSGSGPDARAAFVEAVLTGTLTADELLRRYCTLLYAKTGSYQDTARRLGIDRRTARTKVDETWLGQLKAEGR